MKSKILGVLQINGEPIATVRLEPEHAVSGWGVQQVGRRWFDYDGTMKNIRVMIGDDTALDVELVLEKTKSDNGRIMYSGKLREGRVHCWCNLVRGEKKSWGVTIGLIMRKQKEIKIPDSWKKKRREQCYA